MNQVAFNRRYNPLSRELKHSLENLEVQHFQVEFTRVNRSQEDFATTAIHAINLVRYLAGEDYNFMRFGYRDLPDQGPNTVNFTLNCEMAGGQSAQLNFYPVSGEALERYTVYAVDNLLSANISGGADTPGRFHYSRKGQTLRDVDVVELSQRQESYLLDGFYDEDAAFFDTVQNGVQPSPDFSECRQSVEIMQRLRQRAGEFRREKNHRLGINSQAGHKPNLLKQVTMGYKPALAGLRVYQPGN